MEPSNTLAFLGQFTMYTFVSVLGWRVESARRSSARFCSGAAPVDSSVCGTWAATLIETRGELLWPYSQESWGAIVVLGSAWPAVVTVIVAMAVWNGAFGGVPSIYQACAVHTHAVSPELAGAWVNATVNLGIAGGAAIGAGLLQSAGLWSLPWVGAALVALSLAVILLARRAFPRLA